MGPNNSFMRVSNTLADALMRSRLTACQWCVLFWALRHTLGWNRHSAPFTWYRVAKEIGMNRSSALRAGRLLVRAGLLSLEDQRLRVQTDPTCWSKALRRCTSAVAQRKRCGGATLFRRTIDMSKDFKKKERSIKKEKSATQHPGAARPISGKYAHLTEA